MGPLDIGKMAERIAFEYEVCFAKPHLKHLVRDVSQQTALGYDIEAIEETEDGIKVLKAIEVKTWNKEGYFFITQNEVQTLRRFGENGWVYLVDIYHKKVVRKIRNPVKTTGVLVPTQFTYNF